MNLAARCLTQNAVFVEEERADAADGGASEPASNGVSKTNYDVEQLPTGGEHDLLEEDFPALARRLFRDRKLREHFFEPQLFQDPSWDILLDLFASAAEGQRVSVGSACLAGAPATTGLRHLQHLEQIGYVRRTPGSDRRKVYVELTELAERTMHEYLQRAFGRRTAGFGVQSD
jgi:hypothetical protein